MFSPIPRCRGHLPRRLLLAAATIFVTVFGGAFDPSVQAGTPKPLVLQRGDSGDRPIAWIARATACAAPLTWIKSPLIPFDRRPAWLRKRFSDEEGVYTRKTSGDAEAGKSAGPTIDLVEGQSAIFDDWVSFPMDPKTDRVLFYGGGHGGYAGGDIYLWDIANDSFEMVFEPRRLKYLGKDPRNPKIEIWLPSDGAPAAPHTYGVALWHSSGKVIWHQGGAGYGYVNADGTWQRFRNSDPAHSSSLKIFDATNLTPGRGDPARWSWGPDIKQVVSAAPSAVELPDGRIAIIDEALRLALYDLARNRIGPWQLTRGSGRIGAAYAVYSAYDNNIYVRSSGGDPAIWRIDPQMLTAKRLAIPDEIPVRKPGAGAYRDVWFDRSGLVAAGSRLMVIGGFGRDARGEPGQNGHIYFYDLAADDKITWVAADGPNLWTVHGKAWYLPRDGVLLALPGADQPPWLMRLPWNTGEQVKGASASSQQDDCQGPAH